MSLNDNGYNSNNGYYSCSLTGTPLNVDVGTGVTVTIRADDGTVTVDKTYTIEVINTPDAPTFVTSSPLANAAEDSAYSVTVSVADVDGGYLYIIIF